MKKIIFILLIIAISLPLYAQKNDQENVPKKTFSFARQSFEIGIDAGLGFDNNLVKVGDLLDPDKQIDGKAIIDLNEFAGRLGDNGLNLNAAVDTGFYVNLLNINLFGSKWELGIFAGADGNINFNLPKSLFTLVSEGNVNQTLFTGNISATGGIYADVGVRASGKFGKLRIGATPSVFAPLIYIPRTGIDFTLNTDTNEGLSFDADGGISIYSPFSQLFDDNLNIQNVSSINLGFDISAHAQLDLFPFLDVGGSISNIPVIPAKMKDRLAVSLDYEIPPTTISTIIDGGLEIPEFGDETLVYGYRSDSEVFVVRPLRFDVFTRYKPFSNEFIVIRPNIGMSIDINNKEPLFNTGIGVQLNIVDLLIINIGTDYTETIWTHHAGLALNLRFFELNLRASLRSSDFKSSFDAQGFGFNAGVRFGF
ncbi:MAG: DUF5723 family protein [Treponema sp.]|nr:DUF5723 family protein [Treponema sp.]